MTTAPEKSESTESHAGSVLTIAAGLFVIKILRDDEVLSRTELTDH